MPGSGTKWRWLRAEISAFYDEETRDFTLSWSRDLWKTLLVFLAAFIFHLLLEVSPFRPLVVEALEVIDDAWIIATIGYGAVTFVGKLIGRRGKKP